MLGIGQSIKTMRQYILQNFVAEGFVLSFDWKSCSADRDEGTGRDGKDLHQQQCYSEV